ncbi:MAG: hypothetical protein NT162_02795 [Candidatus Woesebacteria bacterium]|nr:hypothetical protein [Candidatus Woesebacteria bacterium]
MKLIAKIILIIIFVPVFLLFLLAVNLRFQLLAPSFWEKAFTSGDVYSRLSVSINKNLETQTIAEGGRASDVKVLTELITSENLKETINKNVNNILQFVNGKTPEIIVYVPVGKIPKSLLSKNFSKITEQTKLTDLLKKFNMSGVSPVQIQMIAHVGVGAWFFFVILCLISVLLLYPLYLLVDSGKRVVAPGVALILSGLLALFVTASGTIIRINWAKDITENSNIRDATIGIIAPPVIQGVLSAWLLFAAAAIILGIVLFFVKKKK